jgi:hypothetical protein
LTAGMPNAHLFDMQTRRIFLLLLSLLAASLTFGYAGSAAAANRPIADFVGEYVGHTIVGIEGPDASITARDLAVSIRQEGRGFELKWTTILRQGQGQASRKSYSIRFIPTHRPNVFSAGQRVNPFGQLEPLDPIRGDPYVWARIKDATLTVYAIVIGEDGGYEMQVYDRTLTKDGMKLRFKRTENGRTLREITGELRRVRG